MLVHELEFNRINQMISCLLSGLPLLDILLVVQYVLLHHFEYLNSLFFFKLFFLLFIFFIFCIVLLNFLFVFLHFLFIFIFLLFSQSHLVLYSINELFCLLCVYFNFLVCFLVLVVRSILVQ